MSLDFLTLYWRTFRKLAEIHFHVNVTSNHFLIIFLAVCIVTLMVGRLYAVVADKSSRGFIACFIGYWLPVLFFATGFTLSDYHLSNYIQDPTIRLAVNYIIAGFLFLVALLLLTPLFIGVGRFKTILVYIMMFATNVGVVFLTKAGIDAFGTGAQSIEVRKKIQSLDDINP
ncbi:MAG: hypothetical protein COZ46_02845 [Verrucomicrobia bacterium CG_4_10_14_3_um_filter_43_23]|nr:MAG: hypothetical protein AUJ82_00910 [Verrucomicrobia bacterium CG1_02_43_26]PIP59457.1 MAG: hypothetical protein COX01_02470 [Verrucomicrobia bacterium CG22_combo_CG10-13_8_21_14_all_43_17]PIX58618.1 MAG: hypothetical protein COZ46_02845 [Verrucomicrobia bacterium CG_4_10_14_3_um_filter_43_23]PIY61443.1 MAG: hypothetical protein COY94_05210 [Verrucomicrobia bacterium CG_4_10_14_0_8_um_filter_43_34]PJA43811.1 MAG: hypothetical protein CO175_06130 [Verrucomicrobia bacterium CG_4_9_14_3_um_fi